MEELFNTLNEAFSQKIMEHFMHGETCDLCGSEQYSIVKWPTRLFEEKGRKVLQCSMCGLMRLSHPEEVEYSEGYYAGFDYEKTVQLRMAEFKNNLERIEAQRGGRKGKLLDVGCGTGEFLNMARERGWEVMGVEASEWAAQEARNKYGLEVLVDKGGEAILPPESFDVIVMIHLLEHLKSPRNVLTGIKKIMRHNGLLVIEVPYEFYNIESWWWRCQGVEWEESVYKSQPLHHNYFFSPRTLRKLLSSLEFTARIRTRLREGSEKSSFPFVAPIKRAIMRIGVKFLLGHNIIAYATKTSIEDQSGGPTLGGTGLILPPAGEKHGTGE